MGKGKMVWSKKIGKIKIKKIECDGEKEKWCS